MRLKCSTTSNGMTACIQPPSMDILDHPFHAEILPNTQSKTLHVQLATIFSCPVTWNPRKATNTLLATTCFQLIVEGDGLPSASLSIQRSKFQGIGNSYFCRTGLNFACAHRHVCVLPPPTTLHSAFSSWPETGPWNHLDNLWTQVLY